MPSGSIKYRTFFRWLGEGACPAEQRESAVSNIEIGQRTVSMVGIVRPG